MPHARKDVLTWLPGNYYHLYNRGARRGTIFPEEQNYYFVLRRVKQYCTELQLTMVAYCLMPNHYHFLVRQEGDQPAGLLPQRVFNSYTKAHNKLYQRSGTLFEGRFRAVLVDNDPYLHHLCRYIHANPVKDGIVAQLDAWPFSNYLDWVGQRQGSMVDRTLVEVKRSSDTRIRREVVGQMLDYAANAVVYWPVESLRSRFEATCTTAGIDPSLRLAEFLETQSEDEQAIDRFWGQVKTNLQARKLRMIFVADQIPPELRRIVEFLNEQMDPAEILAVELRQYVGSGLRTLTPRLIGQTSEAQQKKGSPSLPKRQWDEPSFFTELHSRAPEAAPVARAILDWARPRVTRIWWGKGSTQGSFVPTLHHNGIDHQLFAVWTVGTLEFYFQWHQYKPPFDQIEMRQALLQRLNAIPGINLAEDVLARRPTAPLNRFVDNTALQELLATYTWMLDEIKATS